MKIYFFLKPFPPIRRDIGRLLSSPFLGIFASSMPHKGSAAFAPPNIGGVSEGRGGFAPPNIGGVSEGRGGFATLRLPHATQSNTSIPACSSSPLVHFIKNFPFLEIPFTLFFIFAKSFRKNAKYQYIKRKKT